MTAPQYSDVSQESPREICANLCETFRAIASAHGDWDAFTWEAWASRLERAVQKLDAEKSPPIVVARKVQRGGVPEPPPDITVLRVAVSPTEHPEDK